MKNQWLFEAPLSSVPGFISSQIKIGSPHWLFEAPMMTLPDFSEGTGRRKATRRINPRWVDEGDIQWGGVEPIRKPRPKPPRVVTLTQSTPHQSPSPVDPLEAARQQANRQGSLLVSVFKKQMEKSNPSGTAVRAQARLKAGAELIRRARNQKNQLLADAYRIVGQQLIDKGTADMHPSKR